MTPYQAIYGTLLTHYGFDRVDSPNEAVAELLKDHCTTISFLKDRLNKAHERMKHYTDKVKSERSFEAGTMSILSYNPIDILLLLGGLTRNHPLSSLALTRFYRRLVQLLIRLIYLKGLTFIPFFMCRN